MPPESFSPTLETELHDHELVCLVLEGNGHAQDVFRILYDRYHDRLVRFISSRNHTPKAEAEDIAQNTLLSAYMHLSDLENPQCFSSWLYKAAINANTSRLRRRHTSDVQLDEVMNNPTDHRRTPPEIVLHKEAVAIVRDAIQQLPAMHREIIRLFYHEKMEYPDIATFLHVPAGTVRSRLNAAKTKLREYLRFYEENTKRNVSAE